MRSILLLIFLLLAGSIAGIAQPGQTNAELANQYFSSGEFEKAVVYFEKFYEQDAFNGYAGYLQCLLKIKDFDKAEKLIKKQQRKIGRAHV